MIESLILFLEHSVMPWGAFGVFVASVLEEVIAPIPSALIMTMSGFLLISGEVSLQTISSLIFKVAIPASFGVTIGSYFVYFIARFGGKFVIEKFGKYVGLYWSDIESIKSKLTNTKKDEITIGVLRVIPFVPSVAISAFCGILEINWLKYFIITFLGVFVRGIILGFLGWQVGNFYAKYAHIISSVENIVLVSTVFGVIIFFVIKYRNSHKVSAI